MSTPPGILFPEPYMDAAIQSLRENLPGAIEAQNVYYDDFDLPQPEVEDIAWGVKSLVPDDPFIEVGVPDETVENFDIDQIGGDSAVVLMVRAWLAMTDQIDSEEKLQRANYRMGRALTNVLLVPDAFGMHTPVISLRASWRLNAETGEVFSVKGSTLLVFTLAGVESFG